MSLEESFKHLFFQVISTSLPGNFFFSLYTSLFPQNQFLQVELWVKAYKHFKDFPSIMWPSKKQSQLTLCQQCMWVYIFPWLYQLKSIFFYLFHSWWEAAAQHREISSVLCDHLEGWDKEGGRETQEGGDMGIYICIQLIHFVIQQKLTHHCKAIILQ